MFLTVTKDGEEYNPPPTELGVVSVDQCSVCKFPENFLCLSLQKICIEFVTLSSVSTWMGDRNAPTSNENVKSCIDLAG